MYIQFIPIYLSLSKTFIVGRLPLAFNIGQLESTKEKHSPNCNLVIDIFDLLLEFECVLWP